MDINAKHYENLNIEPWDIMKADFTKEQWIGFLKGNILKYTLREKGENYKDAQKIQKYAEELAEAYQEEEEYLNELWENSLEEHNNTIMRETVEKLEVGKWYKASDFSINQLYKLTRDKTIEVAKYTDKDNNIEIVLGSTLLDKTNSFSVERNNDKTCLRVICYSDSRNRHFTVIREWFRIVANTERQE